MNSILKRIPFLLFITTWVLYLIYANKDFSIATIGNPDRYFQSFKFFLANDYYTIMQNGSSYFFNLIVWFFYTLTDNVNWAFFLTNLTSQLIVVIIGVCVLIKVNMPLKSNYIMVVIAIFICNTLSINAYQYSNNDIFQSVFVLAIFHLLLMAYRQLEKYHYLYVVIGVLSALCTLIRPTSLMVICIVLSAIAILEFFKTRRLKSIIKSLILFVIPLVLLTALFHYPSLKENQKLGFYNKNFDPKNNWVQRNYLGAKRMQSGELPIHKNSIFRETTFSYVNNYLKENGENSLPKTQMDFIVKDPLLAFELVIYNIGFIGLKASRYYAFLVLIPFLFLIKKPFLQKEKIPIYLYIIAALLISTIILTLMEYRWIIVYDILLCSGLLISLKYYEISKYKVRIRQLVNISLIMVAIFNVLLTFFIKSNY